ncbi:hypothetical protein P3T37_004448 [Kitasatospora sp. MAA4]|uniref:hypothetical protein n=1 Tax=Kitasatospora sp. MAA4 TaxID=3035093 RepID=UPI002475B888|nr:hypothetical protein [Kitasatospora sp. MAA4]MDH6135038.1 hypothetical protein [Kitasatospora sp. MAA4]
MAVVKLGEVGRMSLKNLPLDASRMGIALCISVEPKTDLETGAVKADRDGVPQWTVSVAVRPEASKAAVIEITVSGEPVGLGIGQHVILNGLEAFWWEMNGRSGLAYRAESVTAAPGSVTGLVPAGEGEAPRGPRGGVK